MKTVFNRLRRKRGYSNEVLAHHLGITVKMLRRFARSGPALYKGKLIYKLANGEIIETSAYKGKLILRRAKALLNHDFEKGKFKPGKIK